MLEEITRQIEGHTICALGDAAAWPVQVQPSSNPPHPLSRPSIAPLCFHLTAPLVFFSSPSRPIVSPSDPPPPLCISVKMQGLIRKFKHVVDDRIENADKYDAAKYLQKSWTGKPFANKDWVLKHGDGKAYVK